MQAKDGNALELLSGRALMALKHYLDYEEFERADFLLESVYKDYRKHQEEVRAAVKDAFNYILKYRYEEKRKAKVCPRPPDDRIAFTKQRIVELAKKVWKL